MREKEKPVPLSDDEMGAISGGKIEEIEFEGSKHYFVSVPIIKFAEFYDSKADAEAAQKNANHIILGMYAKYEMDYGKLPTPDEFLIFMETYFS